MDIFKHYFPNVGLVEFRILILPNILIFFQLIVVVFLLNVELSSMRLSAQHLTGEKLQVLAVKFSSLS